MPYFQFSVFVFFFENIFSVFFYAGLTEKWKTQYEYFLKICINSFIDVQHLVLFSTLYDCSE